MAQKSIMSFFKRVKAKDEENIKTNDENKDTGASTSNPVDSNSKAETVAEDKGNITEDSPVKNSAVKRKRVQAIESDSEQEEPILCNNRDLTKAEKDSLIIKPDEKKVCLISNIVVDGIPLRRCAGTPADSIALTKRMIDREKGKGAEEGTVKKVDSSGVMKEEIKLEEDKLNTNIIDNKEPEAIVSIKKREILPDDDTVMISPGKQCNKSDDSGLEDSPVKPTRKSIKGRKSKILSDDSDDSNDGPPNKKSKSPEKSKLKKSSKTKSPVKSESSKKSPTADKNKTDSGTVRKSLQNFFAPRKPVENTESEVKEDNKENKKVSPIKNKNNDDKKGKAVEESKDTNDKDEKATDNNVKEKVAVDDAKKKNSIARADDPVTGSDYNPAKSKYHPIDDAIWKRDEKVPFIALARTMECIESTRSRLKIVEILSNYFRSVIALTPQDLLPSIYLCLNKLAPDYYNIELGIAEFSLMKAIAQCTGRSVAQIKADTASTGDLGIVAEQSKSNQRMMFKPNPLTVRFLFEKLKDVGQMSGQASMSKKLDKIQSLFVACRGSEGRFLIRSLLGKLRIGLAEQSVLQALAVACVNTPPGQDYPPEKLDVASSMSQESFKSRVDAEALIIKSTYCECPNYDMIIPVLLEKGVKELPNHCRITPGIPIKPMLAHPTKGVHEVLHRFDGLKFTCEWKYDGERAQIHRSDDSKISIYSRNQENNTSKYPDIVSRLPSSFGPNIKSCIIDSEAVAWDVKNKKIRPFQILSTRKRKDANESEIKVQVIVFMFDLLYLNGKSLVKETLTERRRLLKENFIEVEEQFVFAKSLDTSTMEEVQDFLDDSVKGNCEGLMVKTLQEEATYEIAKRSRNWLKLKKDYLDGVGDTLDLVVIGGYLGRGKRTGCYGGFLLACYDPSSEEYQSICKIGTGFSDEDLQKHSEYLKQHIIQQARPYYRFDSSHEPDHWFDPTQVWEIKCADLSLSPAHRAAIGIVDPEKGISLRFPRFLRIRDDKSVEDATSARQVADMYLNQDQIKNQEGDGNRAPEEDFY